MRHTRAALELLAPVVLVVAVALFGTLVSTSTQTYVITTLVNVAIVVALYVFIGNSGVLSFGHVSFVAVGAWAAGVLSMPVAEKPAIMPNLAGFLRHTTVGNAGSLAIAAGVGAVYALVVGLPLMRLSGLAAGIATFGVLEITHNVLRYWEKIGPGLNTFSAVPETTGLLQAAVGALIAVAVAFLYQRSRYGRMLRATRVHHARDARDRRHHEPVGRSCRRGRRQRGRLLPGGGGERRAPTGRHGRPTVGHEDRRCRDADGARPDPAAHRAHGRS